MGLVAFFQLPTLLCAFKLLFDLLFHVALLVLMRTQLLKLLPLLLSELVLADCIIGVVHLM